MIISINIIKISTMHIILQLIYITIAFSSIVDDWKPIIEDQLMPYKKISQMSINKTFEHLGSHIIFQYINNTLTIYDPEGHCLCNRSHDKNIIFEFHLRRCKAMQTILSAVVKYGNLSDFEFVWSLDDIQFWHKTQNTMNVQKSEYIVDNLYPGFGAVRCWSKGSIAMPFYGSHIIWNVSNYEFPNKHNIPLHKRFGKAVFRGGIDRGCSFEKDTKINYNSDTVFPNNKRDCGRYKLYDIAKKYPSLVDYNGTNDKYISLDTQSEKYRYILSIEGFAGWADRLPHLLALRTMIVFNQNHPCDQWFEPLLKPYEHFIPVANDFSDLPAKVIWANNNPKTVERILNASTNFANKYLTKEGIIAYMYTMLEQYIKLLNYKVVVRNGAYPITNLNNYTFMIDSCKNK